jgi:hypothetical protein
LSSHLRLGLPSCLFPSGLPINILYAFLFFSNRTIWPAHLILIDLIIVITVGEGSKLWSFSLCGFPHHPVTTSPFGPNVWVKYRDKLFKLF